MKITVTHRDGFVQTHEGDDIIPIVNEDGHLEILTDSGRCIGIHARGEWAAVNTEGEPERKGEAGDQKTTVDESPTREHLAAFIWNWRHTINNRIFDVGASPILDALESTFGIEPPKDEEPEDEEAPAPSIGTAYIDVKPRLTLGDSEPLGMLLIKELARLGFKLS